MSSGEYGSTVDPASCYAAGAVARLRNKTEGFWFNNSDFGGNVSSLRISKPTDTTSCGNVNDGT